MSTNTIEDVEALVARGTNLTVAETLDSVLTLAGLIAQSVGDQRAIDAMGRVFELAPAYACPNAWSVAVQVFTARDPKSSIERVKAIHPRVVEHVVTRCFGVPVGKPGINVDPKTPPELSETATADAGVLQRRAELKSATQLALSRAKQK